MILIVGALKGELIPYVNHFKTVTKHALGSASLYTAEKVHILRSGVGGECASEAVKSYLNKFRPAKIINTGTVGRLNPDLSVGSFHYIGMFLHEREATEPIIAQNMPNIKLQQSTLLTVEQAVTDINQATKLYNTFSADLADMEAYFLADISAKGGIPFHSFKVISDHADQEAPAYFMNHYLSLSERLAKKIIPLIENQLI